MAGLTDLSTLLATMEPRLDARSWVFVTVRGASYGEHADLKPLASFSEAEGLTLIVPQAEADAAELTYESVYRSVTLTVHSSLTAVGLTAAVASTLAEHGISANVVAAYYHDHIFVPAGQAEAAVEALRALQQRSAKPADEERLASLPAEP